jgi:hypothetical protein
MPDYIRSMIDRHSVDRLEDPDDCRRILLGRCRQCGAEAARTVPWAPA